MATQGTYPEERREDGINSQLFNYLETMDRSTGVTSDLGDVPTWFMDAPHLGHQ